MKLSDCFGWYLSCVLLVLPNASLCRAVDAASSSKEDGSPECIAPHAFYECLNNLQESERDWKTKLELKEQAVVQEWSQKLNLAVDTAQTTHQQSFLEKEKEWQRVSEERVVSVETEYKTRIESLSKGFEDTIRGLEERLESHEKAQEALKGAHSAALEQERESQKANQAAAIRQALQEADQKHHTAYSKVKHAKSLVDEELSVLRSQVVDYQQRYKRRSNDLLEARQELLKANEIVRLYQMGFHNRWFIIPLTSFASQFYETIGEPLLKELYLLGQPVWDPLNEHLWEPVLQPAGQVLYDQARAAVALSIDVVELVSYQLSALKDRTSEALPYAAQAAVDNLWPRATKVAQVVARFAVQAYLRAGDIYTKQVHPQLEPNVLKPARELYTTKVVPFYENEVVPNWNKHVVPNWNKHVVENWNKHVLQNWNTVLVPWWKKTQPVIVANVKAVQATMLLYWTAVAKTLHAKARERNLPPAIQEVTKYMSENPQASFLRTQQSVVTLLALFFVYLLFFRSSRRPVANKKVAGDKKPTKQSPTKKTNNNGVQFQAAPPSTPTNGGHHQKKKHPVRKGTPFKPQGKPQ